MLKFELYKLLKRKLVLVMLCGIFLLMLYNVYEYVATDSKRTNYEIEIYEENKGILTDEKIALFTKKYKPKLYDYFSERFIEDGKPKKIEDAFPYVNFDIHFGYYELWLFDLVDMQENMRWIFVFVIVAFSMLFTYEKECGMQEILLSTKNGRKKCTRIKVGAAFLVTDILYLIVLLFFLIPLFLSTKGVGWDTSVQMIPWLMDSRYPVDMNFLALLFHDIFMSFLAVNTALLITLFASFLAKSPMTAMCISIAILFFWRSDIIDAHMENQILSKITSLTPLNMIDVIHLLDQAPIRLGGMKLSCLTVAEVGYSLFLVTGGIIFFRVLTKNQKYYAS